MNRTISQMPSLKIHYDHMCSEEFDQSRSASQLDLPTHLLKQNRQFFTDFMLVWPIQTSKNKKTQVYLYKEKKGGSMLWLTLRHTDQLSYVPHPWCHKAVLETQVAWGEKYRAWSKRHVNLPKDVCCCKQMNEGEQISALRLESTRIWIKYQVFQSALHMSANSRKGLCAKFNFVLTTMNSSA